MKPVHEYGNFGIDVTSPEISQKDKGAAAQTFKICIDALHIIFQWGQVTPGSLARAAKKLAKEHIDVDLEVVPEEEEPQPQSPERQGIPESAELGEPAVVKNVSKNVTDEKK